MGIRSMPRIKVIKKNTGSSLPVSSASIPKFDSSEFKWRRRTIQTFIENLSSEPGLQRGWTLMNNMIDKYKGGSICNLGGYSEGYLGTQSVADEVLKLVNGKKLHRNSVEIDPDYAMPFTGFNIRDRKAKFILGDYRLQLWTITENSIKPKTKGKNDGYDDWVVISFGPVKKQPLDVGGGSVRVHRDGTLYLELDSDLRKDPDMLNMMALLLYAMDSNPELLKTILRTEAK